MLFIYAVPYGMLLAGVFSSLWMFFSLWLLMAVGMSGLGLNVMHDAIHGAYTSKPRVNKLLGLVFNALGAHDVVWHLQHNVLHHTYANIHGGDDDLVVTPVLRFSPEQEHKSIHKFQHIYAWFLYGMMTIGKITVNDFVRTVRYWKMGLIKSNSKFRRVMTNVILWKLFYYSYALVLPLTLIPISTGYIVAGFFLMHFVTGLSLSLVFQSGHIMPKCDFPIPDSTGNLDHNFAVHQLMTTSNFDQGNRLMTWFIGGLNYQIEHHLFPTICHTHYPQISKIVAQTTEEFGLPYNSEKTFAHAIWNHGKMLKELGKERVLA
ncbi:MAG: acyl-CoA desaturase [Cyclobacteriaceae bacterium]|nr:acyl-CoA desaturase [Cyclobacteriaceae bacterium HetDA_MAG_MS6]